MRRVAIVLMAVAVMAAGGTVSAVSAHPGHDHGKKIMGTVRAVHPASNHVEITTRDGKTADFYVDAETKYYKGKTTASLSDLGPGTRVVVETKAEGQRSVATVVRVGATVKATTDGHKH